MVTNEGVNMRCKEAKTQMFTVVGIIVDLFFL